MLLYISKTHLNAKLIYIAYIGIQEHRILITILYTLCSTTNIEKIKMHIYMYIAKCILKNTQQIKL